MSLSLTVLSFLFFWFKKRIKMSRAPRPLGPGTVCVLGLTETLAVTLEGKNPQFHGLLGMSRAAPTLPPQGEAEVFSGRPHNGCRQRGKGTPLQVLPPA